jgi:hypothetical protein
MLHFFTDLMTANTKKEQKAPDKENKENAAHNRVPARGQSGALQGLKARQPSTATSPSPSVPLQQVDSVLEMLQVLVICYC